MGQGEGNGVSGPGLGPSRGPPGWTLEAIGPLAAAAGRTSPATRVGGGVSDQGVWEGDLYAQENRGGLRLRSQRVGIWSWVQVACVTLRIVRPPVRTTLAAKSMMVRRRVVA